MIRFFLLHSMTLSTISGSSSSSSSASTWIDVDFESLFNFKKKDKKTELNIFYIPTWLWLSFKTSQLLWTENFPKSWFKK